jgi:hypothetical protein
MDSWDLIPTSSAKMAKLGPTINYGDLNSLGDSECFFRYYTNRHQ